MDLGKDRSRSNLIAHLNYSFFMEKTGTKLITFQGWWKIKVRYYISKYLKSMLF